MENQDDVKEKKRRIMMKLKRINVSFINHATMHKNRFFVISITLTLIVFQWKWSWLLLLKFFNPIAIFNNFHPFIWLSCQEENSLRL